MTPEQLAHFRRELEEQRAQMNAHIADAVRRAQDPLAEGLADPGDEPARDTLVDTALGVGERFTRQREEIDDALLRIERGEYGICEHCGRPIGLDRLEAEPVARLCARDARRADVERPAKL